MSDEAESYCPLAHQDERPRRSCRESVLCGGHVAKLRSTLTDLSTFDAEADQHAYDGKVARHDGAPLTGTGEKPLPIDSRKIPWGPAETEHVSIGDATHLLTLWCVEVAEKRHLSPPRRNLKALCGFLSLHLDWVLEQDWVADFAHEVFTLGGKARAILSPSGNRQFPVGECVEIVEGERCAGTMWALLTPSDTNFLAAAELVCDSCECRVESADWVMYGHRLKKLEAEPAA